MKSVYEQVREFKRKFPGTVAFRIKKHSAIIEKHLNPGEKVLYAFCGQKDDSHQVIFDTCVVAVTNKRIIVGQKRM